jgi:L-fuculose-phosphate aldolase
METVEHFARVTLVAELLGGPRVLPRDEVAKLFDARARYGVKSRNSMEPGHPVVAEDREAGEAAEAGKERVSLTREELVALVEEALRGRGALT